MKPQMLRTFAKMQIPKTHALVKSPAAVAQCTRARMHEHAIRYILTTKIMPAEQKWI